MATHIPHGNSEWQVQGLSNEQDQKPITVEHFESALKQVWKPLPRSEVPANARPVPPHRIGLAVSGGVDSMALAALCAQLHSKHPREYRFHAIVVDHQARKGSREEAEAVIASLEGLGLEASLRTIQWPMGTAFVGKKDFETQARNLRYRELGAECHARGLRYLLLGHHANDQAETILGRIIGKYTGIGLAGIVESGPIPVVGSMWGISEGPHETVLMQELEKLNIADLLRQQSSGKTFSPLRDNNIFVAGKGITVHRPFLHWPKARLKATCLRANVSWKEDETNTDATLTIRNTLRALLSQKRLPRALRTERLMKLGRRVRIRRDATEDSGQRIYRSSLIQSFDPRTQSVQIRLSSQTMAAEKNTSDSVCAAQPSTTFTSAVGRIASLVSPLSHIPLPTAEQAAAKVLARFKKASHDEKAHSFSGGGIDWRNMDENTWYLSRQKPYRGFPAVSCNWHRPDSDLRSASHLSENSKPFGTWQLFDNRVWISVSSSKWSCATVRLVQSGDIARLTSLFSTNEDVRILERQLSNIVSWTQATLPGLAESAKSQILALPTLGLVAPGERNHLKCAFLCRSLGVS